MYRVTENNVVELPVVTSLPIPCERVLNRAIKAELEEVMVIGSKPDGSYFFASSFSDGGNVLWLLEKTRIEIMKVTGNL